MCVCVCVCELVGVISLQLIILITHNICSSTITIIDRINIITPLTIPGITINIVFSNHIVYYFSLDTNLTSTQNTPNSETL